MRLFFAALLTTGCLLAQAPSQSCFTQTGATYPCSSLPQVQIASVSGTAQINVDSGPASSTITTLSQAFPGSTTKGNSILCIAMESAAAIPVITDGQSNTYVVASSSATSGGYTVALASNIVGGTTDSITETLTAGTASFACYELVGAVSVGQIWDLVQAKQGTGSTVSFTPVSASLPGEMIFGAVGFTTGQTVNATPTLGAPITGLVTVDASNTTIGGTGTNLKVWYAAHTTLTAPTVFTPSFALSGSSTYTGVVVSIKAPSPLQPTVDACKLAVKQFANISLTAGGTIITGTAGKTTYICAIDIVTATAQNIALVEGTGTVCATGIAAMAGGTTAATGWNFAANAGLAKGNGDGSVYIASGASGDNVCLLLSGSGQTSGSMEYVQQ
jgi:hypothetical protein